MGQQELRMHPFDQAIKLEGLPERLAARVSADYQNMVGPFGGVSAAKLLQAVLQHPQRKGSPVALTVNYLGPISDSPVEIVLQCLRTNRSNQHWSMQLLQQDAVLCSATCVLAHRKDTWQNQELEFPEVDGPEAYPALPPFPMAKWVNQYDMRFIKGNPLDSEESASGDSESLLWMADKPHRALDFASLTALCDAFFPRLFVRRRKVSPAGTVSLTIHFHCDESSLNALSSPFVLGRASAQKFSGSYFDQRAEVWSQDGQLMATTTQMVYYKD